MKSLIHYSKNSFIGFSLFIIIGAILKQFVTATFVGETDVPIWALLIVLFVIYSVQIINFVLVYRQFLFSSYKVEGISRLGIICSVFGVDILVQVIANLFLYRNITILGLSLLGFVVVLPFTIYWYLHTLCRLKKVKSSFLLSIIETVVLALVFYTASAPSLRIFIILGITILLSYAYFIFILLRKTDS